MAKLAGEKLRRLDMHNGWPQPVAFRAEDELRSRLSTYGFPAPFFTTKLGASPSNEFHIYLGNLVDGLDALPYRPDYLADHCFRIIDAGGKQILHTSDTGPVVRGISTRILASNPAEWSDIVDALTTSMPTSVGKYIAGNILDSKSQPTSQPNPHHKQILNRAKHCLGPRVHDLISKYPKASSDSTYRAGNYIRKLLATSTPTHGSSTSFPSLDLSDPANLLDAEGKLGVLISLLLYTLRNERQHGATVSPFRSSRANLKRYALFYYASICGYAVALGIISIRSKGVIDASDILAVTRRNIIELRNFFGANAR